MNEPVLRPERDETADYYWKYIDLVPEGDIRVTLDGQHRDVVAFLRAIPADRATHAYAPEKWTIAEVIGHLCDAERLFTMRAFWFARGHTTPLPSFESDAVVKISKAMDRPLATLIEELDAIRASTVSFFRYLPEDAWLRKGIASDMPFTPRALAYIAAGHVIHHRRILEERYL